MHEYQPQGSLSDVSILTYIEVCIVPRSWMVRSCAWAGCTTQAIRINKGNSNVYVCIRYARPDRSSPSTHDGCNEHQKTSETHGSDVRFVPKLGQDATKRDRNLRTGFISITAVANSCWMYDSAFTSIKLCVQSLMLNHFIGKRVAQFQRSPFATN